LVGRIDGRSGSGAAEGSKPTETWRFSAKRRAQTPFMQMLNDAGVLRTSNRRLRLALADHSSVVIPKLVDELCSQSILTMELCGEVGRGTGAKARGNRDALLAALRALYAMVFVEGFVHCDLHPATSTCCRTGGP
jgi:hypothetical protein